jgi:nucleoside 2-deoxyribosyltransferase/ubiquinone/menaquinone biosynthesis C-methylase UbiE
MDGLNPNEIIASEDVVKGHLNDLGMVLVNPYTYPDNRCNKISGLSQVVENDIELLKSSDIVLVDISIPDHSYVGTMMEVAYSYQLNKPVYVCVGESGNEKRIWLEYHASAIAKSIDELIEILYLEFTRNGQKVSQEWSLDYYSDIAPYYEEKEQNRALANNSNNNISIYINEFIKLEAWVKSVPFHGVVVDLGSGTSEWLKHWVDKVDQTMSVDASKEMLNISRKKNLYPNVEHIEGNFLNNRWLRSFFCSLNKVDYIFLGFILNALPPQKSRELIKTLKELTSKDTKLVVLENQSSILTSTGHFSKTEIQKRVVPNEQKIYKLYKRNFLLPDIHKELCCFGKVEDVFATDNYLISGISTNSKRPIS